MVPTCCLLLLLLLLFHQLKTSKAFAMLELVGRLIGMSLRFELCLAFQFPTLIWKRLHGQEVTLEDLATVDLLTTQSIVAIRDCDQVCVL